MIQKLSSTALLTLLIGTSSAMAGGYCKLDSVENGQAMERAIAVIPAGLTVLSIEDRDDLMDLFIVSPAASGAKTSRAIEACTRAVKNLSCLTVRSAGLTLRRLRLARSGYPMLPSESPSECFQRIADAGHRAAKATLRNPN